jgi:tetratricopeptide (TPR) repeat protein
MALARGDALAAIADFRSVLRDYPDDPELPKLLASAHAANGEPELALEQLRRAIELQPEDTAARLALAGLYRDQGDAEGAERVLRERLEAVPDDSAAAEALLNQYLQSGKASKAQDLAARIKTARPDAALGHHLAGVAWQAAGDLERAATEFEAVIARQPKAIDALSRLIALRLRQKQPERARQTLDGLLAQDGAHVVARNLIGEVHLAEGQTAAAATEFSAAIALRPDWDVPHRNLALARAADGDIAGARQALAAGTAACGESLQLLLGRARLARGAGAYDEAIDVYSRLLERFPDATAFANDLAMLLADHAAGDPAKLARAKALAARLPTAEPNHLDTQGWVEYRLGNLDRALELLHRAATGAPDFAAIRYHLGMVYAARGDRANALLQLRDAVGSGARFEDAATAATALAALESGDRSIDPGHTAGIPLK